MGKKLPRRDGLRFKPFDEERQRALPLLMQVPGMKDVFDSIARDGHREDGRGLIVWLSTDGMVGSLKPPVFVSAPPWRRFPLLVNTPHPDLLKALITYDTPTSYIVLISAPHSQSEGRYMWWLEQFTPPLSLMNLGNN